MNSTESCTWTRSAFRLPTITIQDEVRATFVPSERYVGEHSPRICLQCLEKADASRLSPCAYVFDHSPHPLLVYPDGTVCISILHTPGDDPTQYEQASERWSPVQSVEKVILSVISMLAGINKFLISIFCFLLNIFFSSPEPNLESGANIDCCKLYRENNEVRI